MIWGTTLGDIKGDRGGGGGEGVPNFEEDTLHVE